MSRPGEGNARAAREAMIRWCDGVDTLPDGSPCRQIPQKHVWSSTVWCSADGLLWRRFYNPVTRRWRWEEEPCALTIDEEGRIGYHLEWWTSADRCVALAWLRRAENGSSLIQEKVTVRLVGDDAAKASERGSRVDSIEWADGEAGDESGESSVPGETWKPLKWSCGLIPCDGGYRVSNYGRLWSPHTRTVTSGFWYGGERWAAVRGGCLVPLRAAAGLVPQEEKLQPRVRLARDALMAGYGPSDLEAASGLELSTCWSYFTRASMHVPGKDLRKRARRLVPAEMWAALERMRGEERLGGMLTDLMEDVRRMVPPRVLEDENAMSKLRLARTALIAP